VYVCVTGSHVTANLLSRSQNGVGDAGYALLGPWLAGATSLTSLNGFKGLAKVRGAYRIRRGMCVCMMCMDLYHLDTSKMLSVCVCV
jgi:hypothetical protein